MTTPHGDQPITPGQQPVAGPAYTAYHQPGYDDPVPPPQPYGEPVYGEPYRHYASPAGVPTQGVNGFAVASFILSFCAAGFGVLSIIFSLVALRQIDRNGQSGKGFAITGLMISLLWILGFAGLYFYNTYQDSKQNLADLSTITAEQTVTITSLKTGDCIKTMPKEGVLFSVVVVPCALAHEGEVAGSFTLSGANYPGEAGVETQAVENCEPIIREYTSPATLALVSDVYFMGPRSADWDRGRKTVTCVAMTAASQTGSVKG